MAKQIIWSHLAENDFATILEYIDKNWENSHIKFHKPDRKYFKSDFFKSKIISNLLQKEKGQKVYSHHA